MISGNILSIHKLSFQDYEVPELKLASSEFIHIDAQDPDFKDGLLDILLLRSIPTRGLEYFGETAGAFKPDERQGVRRRISFWPTEHEEMIDEKFLKLKRSMTGTGKTQAQQTAKLFLDHLMIGESLNSKFKRLCYSLLMNAPELLVIDQSMDLLPENTCRELLKVFSRYADKSGMALIHFTNSAKLKSLVKAREFVLDKNRLVERMPD